MLRKYSTVWVLLASIIPLLGWWTYGLFDLDEGFYAAVTSEMNRRGEWLIPYYNGNPWFEKPILLYWLTKPTLAVFGTAFGPRLPDVLATFCVSALCLWFCRRHFSERIAVVSTLVLASSPLVVALGRMMMTDPILMLCISGAFLTFWESIVGDRRWRILSGLCLGFGVLAKGPVVGILFLPPVIWTYARNPGLRGTYRGGWVWGTICFLLAVSSWYVPAYLSAGNLFVQKFLIEQNLMRFTGGDQAHNVGGVAGLLYYPIIILVAYLPWSRFLVKGWSGAEQSPLNGYLKSWFLTVLIFFTITKAKLPHYMLPLSVPFAILVGQRLVAKYREAKSLIAWTGGGLAFIFVLANFGFYSYYHGLTIGPLVVPGFHAEVHAVARYVHDHASPTDEVVEYKIGRQSKDLGTGHIKIQETKQPSVILYLNRDTLETDDWNAVDHLPNRVWVITRENRVTDQERSASQGRLTEIPVAGAHDYFRLYLLEPAKAP